MGAPERREGGGIDGEWFADAVRERLFYHMTHNFAAAVGIPFAVLQSFLEEERSLPHETLRKLAFKMRMPFSL